MTATTRRPAAKSDDDYLVSARFFGTAAQGLENEL